MAELSIRLKTEDDDQWIIDLRNRLNDHLPPMSVESFRHWQHVDSIAEKAHVERFVSERDGERVGAFFLDLKWWTDRPNSYFIGVSVAPELWNQGIGTAQYNFLIARLTELGAERAFANVRNNRPVSQAFAEHRGFEKTGHADRWSRLEVATANLDGYVGVEAALLNQGIAIKTLADLGESEELLHKLHETENEAVADIPMSEPFTGSPYEQFLAELQDPNVAPDRIWIAMDGEEPVGIAVLPLEGEESAFNGFTGVRRAYRGRGVARALKFKTLEWSKANGVQWIFTANDINNTRMLSINNSLGYQELPIAEEVVKTLR